jgi:hypothetical protein
VPCLTETFEDYGEANIVATAHGALLHGGVYDFGPGGDGPAGGIARSVTKGLRWDRATLPGRDLPPETARGAGDPQLWRDPLTNRVWYTTIGGSLLTAEVAICQVDLSYSDDDGATWVNNPDQPLWGCPAFDFPRPFTGPPRAGEKLRSRYPQVLYICKSAHIMPDRQCWKSLDGGVTFVEIPGSGQYSAWTADVTGVIYGVSDGQLNMSGDGMTSWLHVPVPDGFNGRLSVDRSGNVYLVGIDARNLPVVTFARRPYQTAKRKQPVTWRTPLEVQLPGVQHVHQVALAVGVPGQVAVAYVGSGDQNGDDGGSSLFHTGGPHHGYLTMTDDVFAATPVFRSVQVDSARAALLPYGFPAGRVPPGLANTSTTPSRADYIGVDVAPDGAPWAVFFKDTCNTPVTCNPGNPTTVPASTFTNWKGAVATMS